MKTKKKYTFVARQIKQIMRSDYEKLKSILYWSMGGFEMQIYDMACNCVDIVPSMDSAIYRGSYGNFRFTYNSDISTYFCKNK